MSQRCKNCGSLVCVCAEPTPPDQPKPREWTIANDGRLGLVASGFYVGDEEMVPVIEKSYVDQHCISRFLHEQRVSELENEIRRLLTIVKVYEAALKLYAQASRVPIEGIIKAYETGGTTFETIQEYVGSARQALATAEKIAGGGE